MSAAAKVAVKIEAQVKANLITPNGFIIPSEMNSPLGAPDDFGGHVVTLVVNRVVVNQKRDERQFKSVQFWTVSLT